MSKLNSVKKVSKTIDTRLAGDLGAKVAKQDNVATLRKLILDSLLSEDIAYKDGNSITKEIKELVPLCTPEEVYDLALETRLKQKLKHIPLFLAREMCRYPAHRVFVGTLLPEIITRPDMLTDFLALYWKEGKQPLCNQAKKGLANCFHKFNEYQFAKYDRDAPIKLRDVMFLSRPKPKSKEESELFKRIANRTLTKSDTGETLEEG